MKVSEVSKSESVDLVLTGEFANSGLIGALCSRSTSVEGLGSTGKERTPVTITRKKTANFNKPIFVFSQRIVATNTLFFRKKNLRKLVTSRKTGVN
jgi:hypothetical protein